MVPRSLSASAPGTGIERVELATGRRENLAGDATLSSTDCWKGMRLLRVHAEPGEIPEGYFARHVVGVHLSGAITPDVYLPTRGWKACRLTTSSVKLFPAGMPYAARWARPVDAMLVEIAPEFVLGVAGCEVSADRLEFRPFAGVEDRFIAHTVLALGEEARAGAPGGRLYGESLGAALVAHLLRKHGAFSPDATTWSALSQGELGRVLQYIGDNLEARLSLQDLAGLLQMNVYRFIRSFKQSTSVPPHQYVLRQRVARAKSLLSDPDLSITEVALRSGFASHSHFATAFRRITNVTPRSYRDSVLRGGARPSGSSRPLSGADDRDLATPVS